MAIRFDTALHPRGAHGRFASTGRGRAAAAYNANVAQVVQRLSTEQRQRLLEAVNPRNIINQRFAQVKQRRAEAEAAAARALNTAGEVASARRAVRVRSGKTKVNITESGVHVDPAHHSSFRVEHGEYNYQVIHEGRTLSLNNHGKTLHYDGYRVRGVPDLIPDVKSATTPELIDKLAIAHHMTTKGNAPTWNPEIHGSIDPSLVGQRRANPGVPHYGVMQIHHVDQWALDPSKNIQADLAAGRITQSQAEQRYLNTIERRPQSNTGTPAHGGEDGEEGGSSAWQLKLRPKEEREFVVLAGGTHQGGTPLFFANHPQFYNPDKDKFDNIGIPYVGEGSRDWFDKSFRKPFWKEYAKHQVNVIGKELDTRVKKGKVTAAAANDMLTVSQNRVKRNEVAW